VSGKAVKSDLEEVYVLLRQQADEFLKNSATLFID